MDRLSTHARNVEKSTLRVKDVGDPNKANNEGVTALMFAAEDGHESELEDSDDDSIINTI